MKVTKMTITATPISNITKFILSLDPIATKEKRKKLTQNDEDNNNTIIDRLLSAKTPEEVDENMRWLKESGVEVNKLSQNTTIDNKKQKKEYISAKEEVMVWLALIGIGLLVVGTILSAIAAVIHFTADTRAEIESGDIYFLYGIAMVVGGTILSKTGLGGIGNKKKKQQQSQDRPLQQQQDQQQHKITAWLGRSHKEQEESKKKEEKEEQQQQQQQQQKEQPPLTAEEIRSKLTDKDKRIMQAGKVTFILGLVLFGLAIILAFVLGFRSLYFSITAIVLIIAGAITYLWALGSGSTQRDI
jgi:hypothetical protein